MTHSQWPYIINVSEPLIGWIFPAWVASDTHKANSIISNRLFSHNKSTAEQVKQKQSMRTMSYCCINGNNVYIDAFGFLRAMKSFTRNSIETIRMMIWMFFFLAEIIKLGDGFVYKVVHYTLFTEKKKHTSSIVNWLQILSVQFYFGCDRKSAILNHYGHWLSTGPLLKGNTKQIGCHFIE